MGTSSNSLFWMVALPLKHREKAPDNAMLADEDRNILYSYLKDKLNVSADLAQVQQFSFPDFKVGTLDSLVTAGEDLAKMDPQVEATVNRLVTHLRSLISPTSNSNDPNGRLSKDDREQLQSSLVINEVASPEAYTKSFQWNVMKYRTDKSVTEIADMIVSEVQQIDNLLKSRLATYNQSKTVVAAIERKSSGNLLTKDLSPYVKQADFTEESEFIVTLLVVVPVMAKQQWEATYEKLCPMVVPRSSRLLAKEEDYLLYNVIVFRKTAKEFIKAAAIEKFIVREYNFNQEQLDATSKTEEAQQGELKAQWASLVRLLKTNFGEIFSAWVHLKVLRLFVESVLHYGLPPQFLALTLKPIGFKDQTKSEKRLCMALLQHLEQLRLPGISSVDIAASIQTSKDDPSLGGDTSEEAELWSALNMATRDENPFVKVTLKFPF